MSVQNSPETQKKAKVLLLGSQMQTVFLPCFLELPSTPRHPLPFCEAWAEVQIVWSSFSEVSGPRTMITSCLMSPSAYLSRCTCTFDPLPSPGYTWSCSHQILGLRVFFLIKKRFGEFILIFAPCLPLPLPIQLFPFTPSCIHDLFCNN